MKNIDLYINEKLKIGADISTVNVSCENIDDFIDKYNLHIYNSKQLSRGKNYILDMPENVNNAIFYSVDDKYDKFLSLLGKFCKNELHFSSEIDISVDAQDDNTLFDIYEINDGTVIACFMSDYRRKRIDIQYNDEQTEMFIIKILDFIIQSYENNK